MGGTQGTAATPPAEEEDEVQAFGAISPDSETLKTDFSSRIELSLRLEELTKPGRIFTVIYSKWAQEPHWVELGTTETNEEHTSAPVFKRLLKVDFRAERQHLLRFEVYRVKDESAPEDDDFLQRQKFLGAADALLVDVMLARSKALNAGWLVKELRQPLQAPGDPPPGRLCIYAEEDMLAKQTVSFSLAGRNIKSTDFWKLRGADPYCILNRTIMIGEDGEEELDCTPVFRTEVARKTGNPKWKRMEFTAAQLCRTQGDQEIVIEVHEWFRVQQHRYVGECVITFDEIAKAFRDSKPLVRSICIREGKRTAKQVGSRTKSKVGSKTSVGSGSGTHHSRGVSKLSKSSGISGAAKRLLMASKESRATTKSSRKSSRTARSTMSGGSTTSSGGSGGSTKSTKESVFGKVVGKMAFETIGVIRTYTFLDYLRGGLDVKLLVAVDFTRSNAGPTNPSSFHCVDPSGADSAYATALRAVGEVMKSYASDNHFPMYGFGAQIPPSRTVCSDCFALTGDFSDPEVEGVEGIIRAYKRALQVVRLHGPSHLHEVIKVAAETARPYAEARTPNDNGVDMKYFVLLILTDGAVHQQQRIVDEIMNALHLPLSIMIVGIGDEDCAFLGGLAGRVSSLRRQQEREGRGVEAEAAAAAKAAAKFAAARRTGRPKAPEGPKLPVPTREVVHFVAFQEYRDRPAEFAAATLENLPREVVGYFARKDVKPRNLEKFEDPGGAPLAKTIPTALGRSAGSKLPGSRTGTKLSSGGASTKSVANSRASSTLTTPEQRGERELTKNLEQLPVFIREERERLVREGERLGYERHQINRALRDGVPAATIEVLVDNILNGGYGKSPSYKDAAEAAIHEPPAMELTRLPGQPDHRPSPSMLWGLSDFDVDSTVASPPPSPFARLQLASKSHSVVGSRFATKDLAFGVSQESAFEGLHGRSASASRQPSKSILKASSRGPSKDHHGGAAGPPHSPQRLGLAGTKESIGSSGSLRAAASVRFHDLEPPPLHSNDACGVCFEAAVATEFQPCGHRVACADCAARLRRESVNCPLCQAVVREVRALPAS